MLRQGRIRETYVGCLVQQRSSVIEQRADSHSYDDGLPLRRRPMLNTSTTYSPATLLHNRALQSYLGSGAEFDAEDMAVPYIASRSEAWTAPTRLICNIGALIIRMGLWGPVLHYNKDSNHNKNNHDKDPPPKKKKP